MIHEKNVNDEIETLAKQWLRGYTVCKSEKAEMLGAEMN